VPQLNVGNKPNAIAHVYDGGDGGDGDGGGGDSGGDGGGDGGGGGFLGEVVMVKGYCDTGGGES
jgi:hypothetical protein